jgi:hypothetical protein
MGRTISSIFSEKPKYSPRLSQNLLHASVSTLIIPL